jgi:hypothetical protein
MPPETGIDTCNATLKTIGGRKKAGCKGCSWLFLEYLFTAGDCKKEE